MKIDVCIITRSPAKVKDLIATLKRVPCVNRIIIETSKPLGLARMKAIQQVSTEWFAFIDDDIVLTDAEKWFDGIKKYTSQRVGAIEGTDLITGLGIKCDRAINTYRLARNSKPRKIPKDKWSRGFTTNTLIRLDIVKDWKPSSDKLEAFEDLELTKHIQKKGYDWLKVPIVVWHIKTWARLSKNALWQGSSLNNFKLYPKKEVVFMITKMMIDVFRCIVDLRMKMCWRARVIVAYEMFLEIVGFLSKYHIISRKLGLYRN